jgi:predicted MPP superfamily phosphohydrolase
MQWNWLHLSDLHCGMRGYVWLWPRIEQQFLADLTALYERAGPWDFVLMTGDLTAKGMPDEFRAVDAFLKRLWAHLATLSPSSAPVLLAVPGNHDLVRPSVTPASQTLREWAAAGRVPPEFWELAEGAERQVVDHALSNYRKWWRHCPPLAVIR